MKLEKMNKEEAIEIIKKNDSAILVTKNEVFIHGRGPEIMAMFGSMVSHLSKNVPKEILKSAFETGLELSDYKEEKNLKETLKDMIEELF